VSIRRLVLGLLLLSPAAVAAQEPVKEGSSTRSSLPPQEEITFVYHNITWTYEPGAAPVTARGVARLLRAPGEDPTARRGSFEVLVPKGPLQEFFAKVAQYNETNMQFLNARLGCIAPDGSRVDLGSHRLGLLSYKETPSGDGTTEQFFTIEIAEGRIAACRGSEGGP
jgi:hypothetical protein